MYSLPLPVLNYPFGLSSQDIKAALLCWCVYACLPIVYCLASQLIYTARYDISVSVVWSLGDWGIWIVVLPFIFKYLKRFETLKKYRTRYHLLLVFWVLLFVLPVRAGMDAAGGTRDFAKSLLHFLPIYTAAIAVIITTWQLVFRERKTEVLEANQTDELTKPYPKTLLVNRGNSERLIKVEDIQCIKAAGNYVEIYCDNQPFLVRSTMKHIEKTLPPSLFLRTHRSHIININEIDRIHDLASDAAAVKLRSGMSLSIGKKYKPGLKNHRLSS